MNSNYPGEAGAELSGEESARELIGSIALDSHLFFENPGRQGHIRFKYCTELQFALLIGIEIQQLVS
jgi:hypothetical protein